ncbi:MAG TPA: laccase domain-containing protein, partial [Solirubrobacterales bacterium]|nr:laccase domain-containing protein [Solirubrobacterales bacterium]
MKWREDGGVRWLRAELDGACAAFSTRLGGVSEPPFDHLNLGLLTDDSEENVIENRRRLAAALSFEPDRIVFARQVHGTDLIEHPSELREGDGHVV